MLLDSLHGERKLALKLGIYIYIYISVHIVKDSRSKRVKMSFLFISLP